MSLRQAEAAATGRKTGTVRAIYLFPEKGGRAREVSAAEAVKGVGLAGDQRRSAKRAVTLLSLEAWGRTQAEIGVVLAPSTRRANLLVSGLELERLIGRRVRIGEAELLIRGETEPCSLMDRLQPGLKSALKPETRGGVFGSVVTGGAIRAGDEVVDLGKA